MKDPKKPTRTNNRSTNGKEQSLTRKITIALVVILILSLLFLAYTIFGGGGEENENSFLDTSSESSSLVSESSEEESSSSNESTSESSSESESSESSESSSTESSEEESSESEEAVSGEWDPVGTEQTGEHTTDYSSGSQDRIEIKRASSVATGISEGDMIEWWVGNAGDQQVETTVSNSANTATYRVILKWVDGQGWQPVQVEELSDNPYN